MTVVARPQIDLSPGAPQDWDAWTVTDVAAPQGSLQVQPAFNTVYVKRIQSYDYLHILAEQAKILPEFIYTWEVANAATLAKKDLLTAFWIATARAVRWAQQHPDDAAKISQDFLPDEPKAEVSFQLDTYAKNKHWVMDGFLARNYWDYTTAALERQKLIDHSPKYEDFVVTDFALAAREALKT